jgi:hypothetical protein
VPLAAFTGFKGFDATRNKHFDNLSNARIKRRLEMQIARALNRLLVGPKWSARRAPFAKPLTKIRLHSIHPMFSCLIEAELPLRNRLS